MCNTFTFIRKVPGLNLCRWISSVPASRRHNPTSN